MEDESDGSSSNRRGRHPKHLRGKAIGLFYCQQQKERNMVHSVKDLDSLNLSSEKLKQITSLISEPKIERNISDGTYDHFGDSIFKRRFLHTIQSSIQENPSSISNLTRNAILDEQLYSELKSKTETNQKYKFMLKQRQRLPAFDKKEIILDIVEKNQVVLISGETGCGKTTQVAQFILDKFIGEKNGSLCKIVCTQPRRISAISIADRVADERAEKLGLSVGYHIRLERVLPRSQGSVVFCTTGMLLKQMENDPFLVEYSHLILDEIHERDIMSDFLLTLIKQVITKRRDLKLILMSATLNSEKFSEYFGNCQHMNIPGFTFPVEEYYLEDVLQLTDFSFGENMQDNQQRDHRFNRNYGSRRSDPKNKEFYDYIVPHVNNLRAEGKYKRSVIKELLNPDSEKLNYDLILSLLDLICNDTDPSGAILIFLTGYTEIQTLYCQLTEDRISRYPKNKYLILPLHSQMSTVNQKEIFNRPPDGVRKIVLSTNIAETSITIDDIVYVIDTGRIKVKNYNTETNTQTLLPEWVSLANASQRKGRAGRVRPGVCYHLFSSARKLLLENYQKPEILRTRLEEVILMTKLLRLGKIEQFFESLIDKPSSAAVEVSLDLLKRLNALDDDENLTPLGYHLAKLPMNPQLGKMLVFGAIFSCLDPILSVVVTLDYKDPFLLPLGKEREADYKRSILAENCLSDHLFYHKILKLFDSVTDRRKFCWDNFLSMQTLLCLKDLKKQFMGYLYDLNFVPNTNPECKDCNTNSQNFGLLKAIICAGLYPNVFCSMDHKKGRNILRNLKGRKVEMHPKSILAKRPLSKSILVYYLQVRSTAAFIYDATVVGPIPLIFFGDRHRFEKSDNKKYIHVNDDLKFTYRDDVVDVVMRLREKLNWFLEHKISHPGVVDWSQDTEEIRVLRAVMELVTAEEEEGEGESCAAAGGGSGFGGGRERRFGGGRRDGNSGRVRGQFRRGRW